MTKPVIRKLKQLNKNNGIIIRVGHDYNFDPGQITHTAFHPASGGFHVSYYTVSVAENKVELMGKLRCSYPSFIA